MENVSQVILRNLDRLGAGRVELVNPAADGLFRELHSTGLAVRLSCGSHGDYRRLKAMGADAHFEAVPDGEPAGQVILVLPREKEKLAMFLHVIAGRLHPGGRLFLVGANRAGIKSSPRHLTKFFEHADKLDSARHCSLFEASGVIDPGPFALADYERNWSFEYAGRRLEMRSLPGVFAHGRLDGGTRLLLEAAEQVQPAGRILDFASGSGVVAIALLAGNTDSEAVLLDDSALAMESGQRSLAANGLEATSLPSNGLSELTGRFDWIVSNPPFHRGVDNDLDVAAGFFRDAGTFLSENGKMIVVFNRHLPYTGWLQESFNRVDCLAQNREFTVIQASKKK